MSLKLKILMVVATIILGSFCCKENSGNEQEWKFPKSDVRLKRSDYFPASSSSETVLLSQNSKGNYAMAMAYGSIIVIMGHEMELVIGILMPDSIQVLNLQHGDGDSLFVLDAEESRIVVIHDTHIVRINACKEPSDFQWSLGAPFRALIDNHINTEFFDQKYATEPITRFDHTYNLYASASHPYVYQVFSQYVIRRNAETGAFSKEDIYYAEGISPFVHVLHVDENGGDLYFTETGSQRIGITNLKTGNTMYESYGDLLREDKIVAAGYVYDKIEKGILRVLLE